MKEKLDYDPMIDKLNNEDDLGGRISLFSHKYSRTVIKKNKFCYLEGRISL